MCGWVVGSFNAVLTVRFSIECVTCKIIGEILFISMRKPLYFHGESSLFQRTLSLSSHCTGFCGDLRRWGCGSPESSCPCPCPPRPPAPGSSAGARQALGCPLAQPPSALQALKKDGGVPWTGMLAVVHSYVTHKTGETPGQPGRGSDALLFNPALGLLDSLWAQQRLF